MEFPKGAVHLIEKLRLGILQKEFTLREIYHGKHWYGLSNATEARKCVEYLIENKILNYKKIKTKGRPKVLYFLREKY